RRADDRQKHALGEQLSNEPAVPGSECRPNCHLTTATRRSGEQEVGDVGASDEHDERDGGSEEHERVPKAHHLRRSPNARGKVRGGRRSFVGSLFDGVELAFGGDGCRASAQAPHHRVPVIIAHIDRKPDVDRARGRSGNAQRAGHHADDLYSESSIRILVPTTSARPPRRVRHSPSPITTDRRVTVSAGMSPRPSSGAAPANCANDGMIIPAFSSTGGVASLISTVDVLYGSRALNVRDCVRHALMTPACVKIDTSMPILFDPCVTCSSTSTTRSGSGYGSGCSSMLLTTLNTAVVAPMPSAKVRIVMTVQLLFRARVRSAKLRSCRRSLRYSVRCMRCSR